LVWLVNYSSDSQIQKDRRIVAVKWVEFDCQTHNPLTSWRQADS